MRNLALCPITTIRVLLGRMTLPSALLLVSTLGATARLARLALTLLGSLMLKLPFAPLTGVERFSPWVKKGSAAFRKTSERRATKNMTPNTRRDFLTLVIMGQAVKTTGIVLCRFIYETHRCECFARLWKGSRSRNMSSGCFMKTTNVLTSKVMGVIVSTLPGPMSRLRRTNTMTRNSYARLLKKAVILPWPVTPEPLTTTLVTHIVRQLPFPKRLANVKAKKVIVSTKMEQSDPPLRPSPPTTHIVSPFILQLTVLLNMNRRLKASSTSFVLSIPFLTNPTSMTASTQVTGLPSLSLSLSTGCRPRPRPTPRECRTVNIDVELADDTAVVRSNEGSKVNFMSSYDTFESYYMKIFANRVASSMFIAESISLGLSMGPTLVNPALTLFENRTT